MHVNRFAAIETVEEEPIWTWNPGNSRHILFADDDDAIVDRRKSTQRRLLGGRVSQFRCVPRHGTMMLCCAKESNAGLTPRADRGRCHRNQSVNQFDKRVDIRPACEHSIDLFYEFRDSA